MPAITDSKYSMRVCGLSAFSLSKHFRSSHAGKIISAAMRISASQPAEALLAAFSIPAASSSSTRARRYSSSPAGVSAALRPLISNAFTPSSDSSFCTR